MIHSTTGDPTNFIDTILAEAEAAEDKMLDAYFDLVLVEIKRLDSEISRNFDVAEKEKSIVDSWALSRNTKLTERIEFLSKKLQAFIEQRGVKTIDLANGKLQIRKKPDKVEIEDMEKFLQHADASMLDLVPESAKANLTKIKAFVKRTGGKVPQGCKLVTGDEAFSYKLKFEEESEDGTTPEIGSGAEQPQSS